MEDPSWWLGRLAGLPRSVPTERLVAPIQRSESGAAAFQGVTDSGRRYWLKVLGNPQGDQVLVTERIVSAAGELIGAPVRPISLVEIPPALAGWRYGETEKLPAGIAHGSLVLEQAEVVDELIYRDDDDNRVRQVHLLALWDWCLGEDQQWLYDTASERSVWSFDHGFWISGGEAHWSGTSLRRTVDLAWAWDESPSGLSANTFHEVARRIESVTSDDLLRVVASVPTEWKVDDRELEAVAWFLHRRRVPVANRLRAMAGHA